jgi:polyphosphate kinase
MSSDTNKLIHRDISWLAFNYRVLQEAKDIRVPLMERIRFLAIYSSNLDEFFKIRVAHHRSMIRLGKKTKKQLEYDPEQTLKRIHLIVNKQQEEFSSIFESLFVSLNKQGIFLLRRTELNAEQHEYVNTYFEENMLPYVQPVLLVKNKIRPFLRNGTPYIVVHLKAKEIFEKEGRGARLALLQVPYEYLPRFVKLPPSQPDRTDIIVLDDIVRHSITHLFPGYDVVASYSVKLTRDAELYIDDEYSGDLIEKIKRGLKKRNVGPATRFIYDRSMPEQILRFLIENFELHESDLLPEGRYHNNSDFMKLPSLFGNTIPHLLYAPIMPLRRPDVDQSPSFFDYLSERELMLHFPYHSFEYVERFFEEATNDKQVTHIKIALYRVGAKSSILQSILKAVRAGKQVTAFVEIKARFDEESNLFWADQLEKAGAQVLYSKPGVKVHCKLALITRLENQKFKHYAYLGTGNFNENTAKIYTDIGLFTTDERLTSETAKVFNFLETDLPPVKPFEHLLVGQFNLRPALEELIDFEINQAKKGHPAKIHLKMNSLEDPTMIAKLYEAIKVGVEVQLIIRGICCLVPPDNADPAKVKVISIVDRFLEHIRIYAFHHKGHPKVYLSSADWMNRNLSNRIEVAFPIYNPAFAHNINEIMHIQLADNVKARILDAEGTNQYVAPLDDGSLTRSQMELYYYHRRKEDPTKHTE